jgi:hypothetical protein
MEKRLVATRKQKKIAHETPFKSRLLAESVDSAVSKE